MIGGSPSVRPHKKAAAANETGEEEKKKKEGVTMEGTSAVVVGRDMETKRLYVNYCPKDANNKEWGWRLAGGIVALGPWVSIVTERDRLACYGGTSCRFVPWASTDVYVILKQLATHAATYARSLGLAEKALREILQAATQWRNAFMHGLDEADDRQLIHRTATIKQMVSRLAKVLATVNNVLTTAQLRAAATRKGASAQRLLVDAQQIFMMFDAPNRLLDVV